MKFLRSSVLVAAAVAVTSFSSCVHAQHAGSPLIPEAGTPSEELLTPKFHLRRDLAGSGDGPAPTTAPPATTAPPVTTAPPPTTTAPAPTSTSPATTAPAPTTPAPVTTAPATTAPATTAPVTTAPAETPASPTATTPTPTTAGPATTRPTTSGSNGTETSETPVASRSETPVSTRDGSESGATTNPSAGSTDTNASTPKDSKMGTGTIIGIVCGIVGGVAILAIIAVVLARKRRNDDDDPLSPFELSMDKGYSGVAVMQNNHQTSQYNNASSSSQNNGYSGARTATNNSAMIGGAAVGAGGAMLTTDTPQAGSDAAGVTYTQFYDVVTSPGSLYPHQRLSNHTDDSAAINNDSNLWMSAMEPKDNDLEGASVPPEVSLPADEYDDNHSSFISRNSYDHIAGSESIDIDQSSVLSGGSDLEQGFPDYEDDSSRGSYEL